MPFGLKSATQSFQRLMDKSSFCIRLPGRHTGASKTSADHTNHLRQVFELSSANGLVVNRSKCVFGVQELTYLGHLVTAKGIAPLPLRVDAIRDFPTPDSKASLQRFLDMINYYYRFLPQLANKLHPLHEATKVKGQTIIWTPECTTAFNEA